MPVFTAGSAGKTFENDNAAFMGITRRANLIALCEAAKGKIDAGRMLEIIETPLEEGGAAMDLTVFQMVVVPETRTLWLRVVGGSGLTRIELKGFLE